MFRLPRRQVLKPLRNPISGPLRGPHQTRHLRDDTAPFSGPPSYATLAQRFSPSNPSPISYFARKRAEEAIKRGEFVDIHDIGGVDPKDFDILITDIDNDTLHSEISKLVGIPYLEEATKDEADKMVEDIHGFIYGQKFHMILPCVLSIRDKAHWAFFIVDTGAPLTYISTQVAQAFGLNQFGGPWKAKIAGNFHPVHVAPEDSHFSDINILGADFCTMNQLCAWVHDSNRTVTCYIGDKWEVVPKL